MRTHCHTIVNRLIYIIKKKKTGYFETDWGKSPIVRGGIQLTTKNKAILTTAHEQNGS